MFRTHIELSDGNPFNAREWLRREVLWASLMAPYDQQIHGWQNGTTVAQHTSNVSRRELYATDTESAEAQALSFFNQGKNIGGVITSAALFTTIRQESPRTDGEPLTPLALRAQATCIDRTLGGADKAQMVDDAETYSTCAHLFSLVGELPANDYRSKHALLAASRHMVRLAQAEMRIWQDTEAPFDSLIIPDGGTPRSAGPRVEALQPIFHEIVASSVYQAL